MMGKLISKLYNVFSELSANSPAKILMLGLDGAGKTTILYKIKLNEIVATIPTIGFKVETVSPAKGVNFTVWDIGGQQKIRILWRAYFTCADDKAIYMDDNIYRLVYIVDSNDRERLSEAKHELQLILENEEMTGVPVCVLANKQDLPDAMSTGEVARGLSLHKLTDRKWIIHGACAATGDGIFESIRMMASLVKDFKNSGRY